MLAVGAQLGNSAFEVHEVIGGSLKVKRHEFPNVFLRWQLINKACTVMHGFLGLETLSASFNSRQLLPREQASRVHGTVQRGSV